MLRQSRPVRTSGNAGDSNLAPVGLPAWPQFHAHADRVTVSGRHVTLVAANVADQLAKLIVVAALVYLPYHFWGVANLPDWLRMTINWVGADFGDHLNFNQRKCIYFGLWCVCVLLFRVWTHALFRLILVPLKRRTAVEFTAEAICLRSIRQRYERSAGLHITFSAQQLADLPWILAKPKVRNSPSLSVFYQQARVLVMEYGLTTVPIARFTSRQEAEQFSAVCRYAASASIPLNPTSAVRGLKLPWR